MIKKSIRRVRLYSKYRESRHPILETGWCKNVPWLTLSGDWLEQAGFKIGDEVEITVKNKLLTIKNCSSDGDSRN